MDVIEFAGDVAGMAANKIKIFKGFGKLTSPKEIKITGEDNLIITAEKIIISRLAYLANIINIVNFDQMSSRKQISAIDVIISLIHDI